MAFIELIYNLAALMFWVIERIIVRLILDKNLRLRIRK